MYIQYIIEKVDVSEVGTDIESIRKKLKEREWYWQNNLKKPLDSMDD